VETRDISLAGRIIANFPEYLTEAQQQPITWRTGCAGQEPEANIIKLPNISASMPQLTGAIRELQEKGLRHSGLPGGTAHRGRAGHQGPLRQGARQRGEPGLREGNSDRRVAGPVKEFARKHPHSMGAWSAIPRRMWRHDEGDFYGSEQSA
jgi:isocitrate dehydrogenase